MGLYLDTSALVKLYAEETGSEEVRSAIRDARLVAVSEIGYVEARSALARREREGSLSEEEHDLAAEQLGRDFEEVYVLRPVTDGIFYLRSRTIFSVTRLRKKRTVDFLLVTYILLS